MESLLEIAISNGIFAGLFVWLLFYTLKDSKAREKKYVDVIDKLTTQFDTLKEVKEDVEIIKDTLIKQKEKKKVEK